MRAVCILRRALEHRLHAGERVFETARPIEKDAGDLQIERVARRPLAPVTARRQGRESALGVAESEGESRGGAERRLVLGIERQHAFMQRQRLSGITESLLFGRRPREQRRDLLGLLGVLRAPAEEPASVVLARGGVVCCEERVQGGEHLGDAPIVEARIVEESPVRGARECIVLRLGREDAGLGHPQLPPLRQLLFAARGDRQCVVDATLEEGRGARGESQALEVRKRFTIERSELERACRVGHRLPCVTQAIGEDLSHAEVQIHTRARVGLVLDQHREERRQLPPLADPLEELGEARRRLVILGRDLAHAPVELTRPVVVAGALGHARRELPGFPGGVEVVPLL